MTQLGKRELAIAQGRCVSKIIALAIEIIMHAINHVTVLDVKTSNSFQGS